MTTSIGGTTGVTFPDTSVQPIAAGSYTMGFKNRIINGAMMIDQRNEGAEVNPAANSTYYLDRWRADSSVASKFKIGQNAGSVTPPAGFINYLGCTSLSSYTVGASDAFGVRQFIEGFNIADLAWGTASAATVTLSFWVYSSLTGTFGGALKNSSSTRSYPFSYTISSANTWELKTVTIAGDTTGTWLTTNGVGVSVIFSLGTGATYSGTAGAWAAANLVSATGAVSVVGTSGATFYITGVQLEKGSTATSFDVRPYGTELALCQRYYETQQYSFRSFNGNAGLSTLFQSQSLAVVKRAAPTVSVTDLTYTNASSATGTALSTSAIRLGCTANATSQAGVAGTLIAESEF